MALTPDQATSIMDRLHRRLVQRRPAIAERDNYFSGEQPLCYASKEFAEFYAERYKGWSDNWCQVVGSAAPDLTEFRSIKLPGGADGDPVTPDEQVLLDDWERNDGPAQSAQGFLSSAVTSRSFAMVWGSANDEPTLTWEHSSQCIIGYDPETRRPKYGLKAWTDEEASTPVEFVTLYTDDEVWKSQRPYASYGPAQAWQPRVGVQPVIRNPLGLLPMVEYPNRPRLNPDSRLLDQWFPYAISDIEGTMAAQDAINLLWALLFNAADKASLPARVVMGEAPPAVPVLDENGRQIGVERIDIKALRDQRLLYLTGKDTKIGQWDAADLSKFTEVINRLVRHILSQTKTPARYFTGEMNNVNGASISGLDLPLVQKVRAGHKFLTGPQREVFRRLALVRGNTEVAEACRTARIGWMNPENSSDAQQADAALKDKQIGWPLAAILKHRYGLSQQEIDAVMTQREAEQAADPLIDAVNGLTPDAAGGV